MKKEFFIIGASDAFQHAQDFNRNCWLQKTMTNLSARIISAADQGHRHLDICPHEMTIGAENLSEVAEMLACLDKELVAAGYTTKQEPNGDFTINW
jgi:hypothetical protein